MRNLLKVFFCFLEACLLSYCIFCLFIVWGLSSLSLPLASSISFPLFLAVVLFLFIPQLLLTLKGLVPIFPLELQFDGRLFVAVSHLITFFKLCEIRSLANNTMNFHVFTTHLRKEIVLLHLCCSELVWVVREVWLAMSTGNHDSWIYSLLFAFYSLSLFIFFFFLVIK